MGEFCLVVNVKSNMVDKSCGVGNVIGVLRHIYVLRPIIMWVFGEP